MFHRAGDVGSVSPILSPDGSEQWGAELYQSPDEGKRKKRAQKKASRSGAARTLGAPSMLSTAAAATVDEEPPEPVPEHLCCGHCGETYEVCIPSTCSMQQAES